MMNRRHLLGVLGSVVGGAGLTGLTPAQLMARGRAINSQLPRQRGIGPFTAHQFETVSQCTDLIIPPTDTPGARTAKVPEFIAVIVGEWYTNDERQGFMNGLADLDVRSRTGFNRVFIDLTEDQKIQLLQNLDQEVSAIRARQGTLDGNFFQRLKGLTLYGYYTSEIGMTQELHYQVIPGRYDPCPHP
jgi:hypothetical protein